MTRSRLIDRWSEGNRPSVYASYYLAAIFLGATALAVTSLPLPGLSSHQTWIFLVMLCLSMLAQFHKAVIATSQHARQTTVSYSTCLVFYFASLILLPLSLFVVLVIATHLVEWIVERLRKSSNLKEWYLQPFNMAMHIIAGMAAYSTYFTIATNSPYVMTGVLGSLVGALVYVLLNHLLLAGALLLMRGIPFYQSDLLTLETALPDFIHLNLGYVITILWGLNPWYILPALAPLLLVHRALAIPELKRAAQIDGKTGLLNAHYFNLLFESELQRAKRFKRPVAVLMADLDLLRNINNHYGHLAGDEVLQGIGRIIGGMIRQYDIAGRFGGEEFCIILPETERVDARLFAERLRRAVAENVFEVSTTSHRIHVTMSIGIACFPDDAASANNLIHRADLAVYQAKAKGRNRVQCSSDVPCRMLPRDMTEMDRNPVRHHNAYMLPSPSEKEVVAPENTPLAPQQLSSQAPHSSTDDRGRERSALLPVYLLLLVLSALSLFGTNLPWPNELKWTVVLLLGLLTLLAEIFKIKLYGDSDLSVSVAFSFAAALITGIPGVGVVGAVMALSTHLSLHEKWYWLPVHWSAQVLAGTAPLLVLHLVGGQMEAENLPRLLLPMLLAALGHYLIATLVAAATVSLSTRSSLLITWRSHYGQLPVHYLALCALGLFLAIAYDMHGVLGIAAYTIPLFMLRYVQSQQFERTLDSMHELRRLNQDLILADREGRAMKRTLRKTNEELFLVLAQIVNRRDPLASDHAERIVHYAIQIARELGLPEERVELVRQAAFLHDIGKIAVPEVLLNKAGQLTEEEYEVIKQHPLLGAGLLESLQSLRHLAPFVRHHHERWDGRGYPYQLAGENIPIEARILSVCDSVAAMASNRPYHRAMSLAGIVKELKRCANSQFDPRVVTAFIRIIEKQDPLYGDDRMADLRPPYHEGGNHLNSRLLTPADALPPFALVSRLARLLPGLLSREKVVDFR